jgi:pimeloyl-ACP methyl ester carboxylesterase
MLAYLHGFASGPGSTKAVWFRERFATIGRELVVPDLAPDFTAMSITSQLEVVEALPPGVLIGSSMGGYLAALAAERHPERVPAIIMLAPAMGFLRRWEAGLGAEGVAEWRAEGTMPVWHYGLDREEPLDIGFLDDARRWPELPDPGCPTLILAGRHDETVALADVERFAHARPGRDLVVYDDGHELLDVLEPMWTRVTEFLRTRVDM